MSVGINCTEKKKSSSRSIQLKCGNQNSDTNKKRRRHHEEDEEVEVGAEKVEMLLVKKKKLHEKSLLFFTTSHITLSFKIQARATFTVAAAELEINKYLDVLK